MFEFFAPLDIRVFYRVARQEGLLPAIRAAVREDEGWEVEAEGDRDHVRVRFRMPPEGWEEIEITDLPRAWVWWTPPHLRRSFRIVWEGVEGPEMIEGPILTDSQVYCDFCGDWIPVRPVPVLLGSYALCPSCFRDCTSLTLHQAAEMDGIRLQWID